MKRLFLSSLLLLVTQAAVATPTVITAQPETVNVSDTYESSLTKVAISAKSAMPETSKSQPGYVTNKFVAFPGTGAELSCTVTRPQMMGVGESICAVTFDVEKSNTAVELSVPEAALGRVIQATFRDPRLIQALTNSSVDLKIGLAIESEEKTDVTYANGKTFKIPRLQIQCPGADATKAPSSCVLTGVLN